MPALLLIGQTPTGDSCEHLKHSDRQNVHFEQRWKPVLLWTLIQSENKVSICIILNISSLNASLRKSRGLNFLHSKTQYEPLFYSMLASTMCLSVHVCFQDDVEYLR